jgi:hypothetical protein
MTTAITGINNTNFQKNTSSVSIEIGLEVNQKMTQVFKKQKIRAETEISKDPNLQSR